MSQFYNDERTSLDKEADVSPDDVPCTETSDLDYIYEIDRCVRWIEDYNFDKVCLQFPDRLLPNSAEVALRLQGRLGRPVYVLADTAYESCCIDYVAAAHVGADAIIHYGPVCFSTTNSLLPYINVYEKEPLDTERLDAVIRHQLPNQDVSILLDTPYIIHHQSLQNIQKSSTVTSIDHNYKNLRGDVIYIGHNIRKLLNLKFQLSDQIQLWHYNPQKNDSQLVQFEQDRRVLKRRHFLAEKIKDSGTIGIVIGTLAVRNYLKVIERLKRLIQASGKKYYVISVGKPTVAKLANFPEINVYVIITCAMNDIYENRDFYQPIVTPFDVECALNRRDDLTFSYDYNHYLIDLTDKDVERVKTSNREGDVSLITGRVRASSQYANDEKSAQFEEQNGTKDVVQRHIGTIAEVDPRFGAGYLAERSWKGLEPRLGEIAPLPVLKGRKGLAWEYENETIKETE